MTDGRFTEPGEILRALRALGERMEDVDVPRAKVVIAGRSAGLLNGGLTAATHDCDAVMWLPSYNQSGRILALAHELARGLGLRPNWLNSECADTSGWKLERSYEDRLIELGSFGRLDVACISRLDLIAMKLLATRDRDMDDILLMAPKTAELLWCRAWIERLSAERGPEEAAIAIARARVASLLVGGDA